MFLLAVILAAAGATSSPAASNGAPTGAPASAAPSLEADAEFKKGQAQVEAFEYEKAAATFDAVSKRAGLTDGDRSLALVWLGLACAELRDQARASIAFEDAVTADPLIVLPRDASPKIKALLEDARARVRLRPKPAVTVTTAPVDNHAATTSSGASTAATIPTATATSSVGPPTTSGGPAQGSSLNALAIGTVVVGGVIALVGGSVWGLGLVLRQQAIDAPFQSDAAALRDESIATQVGGQIATGVGLVTLAAGGVMFALE